MAHIFHIHIQINLEDSETKLSNARVSFLTVVQKWWQAQIMIQVIKEHKKPQSRIFLV